MTWYGKTPKQLDILIDSKPKLSQLLAQGDFHQEIKSYNTKLLEYITNTPALISEAITYLTVAPLPTDSQDRKFKFPLQTVELVETETTSILNGFFRESEIKGKLNFDFLFTMLEKEEVMPLLAGYFFRTSLCILNNKYKETVERIYSNSRVFLNLIVHSHHMAISNTIQLFLNLDINKNASSQPDRLSIKVEVIKAIFEHMREVGLRKGPDSSAIIDNLCSVLIQTVDKYYLIVDGKQMIEAITNRESIQVLMQLIKDNNQMAFPVFSFFISLINYYSFSSFNSNDPNTSAETARKNAERLEGEPMINELVDMLAPSVNRILTVAKMDLYHYKLLEMLCHCISIASTRILNRICEVQFFGCLIELLFKHENNNILHMLVEKSFYHIFISERKIYEDYKHHLFCDLDIIEATAARVLKAFPENNFLAEVKKKPYVGHFMRILKIYSGIQPTDEAIIAAIKAKTTTWNKISELLIKPYEAVCFKQIGTYENVPTPVTQEFTIHENTNIHPLPQNTTAIEEVEKEEEELNPTRATEKRNSQEKRDEPHNYLFDNEPAKLKIVDHLTREDKPSSTKALLETNSYPPKGIPRQTAASQEQPQLKKTESYSEFMKKQKEEAAKDIKKKRSSLSRDSKDRKFSHSKGKLDSTSPNSKKNIWSEKDKDKTAPHSTNKNQLVSAPIPKAPIARRAVGPSTYSIPGERENRLMQEEPKVPQSSKSVNMEEVKRIRVIQIDVPKEKKYRRTDQKDKTLLQFLGIAM